jgi:hypothetical protein
MAELEAALSIAPIRPAMPSFLPGSPVIAGAVWQVFLLFCRTGKNFFGRFRTGLNGFQYGLCFLPHFLQFGLQLFLCGGGMVPFCLNFPAHNIPGFLYGGQGYGIGGMFHFPAMGANIPGISPGLGNFDIFYGICGVHKRFLPFNHTPFWEGRQLFQLFFIRNGV